MLLLWRYEPLGYRELCVYILLLHVLYLSANVIIFHTTILLLSLIKYSRATTHVSWLKISEVSGRVTNCPDFFRTVLILSFLYAIKWTLISNHEKTKNSTTYGILNIYHYNFM
jgi:hypothetical protein